MKLSEIKSKIKELDQHLGLMRESWIAADPKKKSTWMSVINKALDQRLKLMKLRDGKAA